VREVTVAPAVVVADRATLTDPVWDNAAAAPGAVQFVPAGTGLGEEITCAGFRDEVTALAGGFIAAGIRPGDRVALMSRTRYEWTLVDYAVLACGAVTVPIYPTASAEQVAWTLSDSGAVGCVAETGEHATLATAGFDRAGHEALVWEIDSGGLDRLAARPAQPGEVARRRRDVGADDVATIIYTSGTTGRPKGCVLTHRNLLTDVGDAIAHLPQLFRSPGASTLLFLPLAHAFARLVQFGCVAVRTRLRHLADPGDLPAELAQFRPTFVLAIPRVLEKVRDAARDQAGGGVTGALFRRAEAAAVRYSRTLDAPDGPDATNRAVHRAVHRAAHRVFDRLVYRRLRQRLGGRCASVVCGGAPLNEDLAHFFRGAGVTVYLGYGLTETSAAVTANTEGAIRIGTVGRPLPGVSVRIADDGEILVRGDAVFQGYWRDRQGTARVVDADGWFHTGDLGRLDPDGYLTVTGRTKDLIVTSTGKNVSPGGLEDRLSTHPLISQSTVVGDRRPFVAALVTLDEPRLAGWLAERGRAPAPVADLRDDPDLLAELDWAVAHANQAVSRAEAVRAVRILPRSFSEERGELTPTMKVRRGVVEKEYADEIDAIYRR
jgi:long-chain acyl-CoA synthetase